MLASSAAFAVMRCASVCLCVCLSDTFVYFVETGKHIVRLFTQLGRSIILVFSNETRMQ